YIALTAAFVMNSPFQSMGYMFLFGLGTLPAVFSVQALQYALKKIRLEQKINYLIPLLSILLGLWIMLRGANLSIPFISPTSTKLELKPNTE
ncbi:MAG: sulfite exporter TauE/SafE family protein, partial [Flavobacteriaceae bacterium]